MGMISKRLRLKKNSVSRLLCSPTPVSFFFCANLREVNNDREGFIYIAETVRQEIIDQHDRDERVMTHLQHCRIDEVDEFFR